MSTIVKIELEEGASMPTYGTRGSAGMDLYAVQSGVVPARQNSGLIETGVKIAPPKGYYSEIKSRSGMALKGITVIGGICDNDYRGTIKVILMNNTDADYMYARGDRIAQLLILPYAHAVLVRDTVMSETDRGSGGFGSTGN